MPSIIRLIGVLCFISCLGAAHAAPVHTVTWTPQNVAPGTEVTLGGQKFVLVRVPLRPFSGTQDYQVSFLAPVVQGFVAASLETQHSTDPVGDPIQIDGFDASVLVSDGRSYNITPAPTPANPDNKSFAVSVQTFCTAQVKVGAATLLSFFHFFGPAVQQPRTEIGETPNALPFADWDAYRHPNAQVLACDKWIDYIRIRRAP